MKAALVTVVSLTLSSLVGRVARAGETDVWDSSRPHLHTFSSMQLRTTGSSTVVQGEPLPVDSQMGMLCGSLVAWRLGARWRSFGGYGIAGAGTWTVFRVRLPAHADRATLVSDSVHAGYGFVGLGGAWRLQENLMLAAEVDVGGLALGSEDDVIMAPSPTRCVSSAVAGLRFAY